MTQMPSDEELLLPMERKILRGDFREYFKIKRNNNLATMQGFPYLWECYELLDEVWMREFSDMERPQDVNKMLPLILFLNGHARFRIALELAFSCCIGDAWNVLRSGIESVAHAHKLVREPHLVTVWAEKDDGPTEAERFKDAFERNKRKNLFPPEHGLGKLHDYWSDYSEWGTHTTVASLGQRFASKATEEDVSWALNYFEADPKRLAISLASFLLASHEMEKALFGAFKTRLELDHELIKLRARFAQKAEKARLTVIKRFKVRPPGIWP